MSIGVIGKKIGMTSIFAEDGTSVPVSVVEIQPNTVTALRTSERDGYTAVQLGAGTAKKLTKPRKGQLKGLPPVKHNREFRLDDISEYEVGQTLGVALFEEGEIVDVSGVSKGRGFSGTIKRHGFRRPDCVRPALQPPQQARAEPEVFHRVGVGVKYGPQHIRGQLELPVMNERRHHVAPQIGTRVRQCHYIRGEMRCPRLLTA